MQQTPMLEKLASSITDRLIGVTRIDIRPGCVNLIHEQQTFTLTACNFEVECLAHQLGVLYIRKEDDMFPYVIYSYAGVTEGRQDIQSAVDIFLDMLGLIKKRLAPQDHDDAKRRKA